MSIWQDENKLVVNVRPPILRVSAISKNKMTLCGFAVPGSNDRLVARDVPQHKEWVLVNRTIKQDLSMVQAHNVRPAGRDCGSEHLICFDPSDSGAEILHLATEQEVDVYKWPRVAFSNLGKVAIANSDAVAYNDQAMVLAPDFLDQLGKSVLQCRPILTLSQGHRVSSP